MRIKNGASIAGLDIRMRPALIEADKIWMYFGQELVITSGLDGDHSAGSLHYYGLAVDCRTRYFNKQKIERIIFALKEALPKPFDIVFEGNHIHIEFDPF